MFVYFNNQYTLGYISTLLLPTLFNLKYTMLKSLNNEVIGSYCRCRRSTLLFSSVSSIMVLSLPTLLEAAISSLSRAFRTQSITPKTRSRRQVVQDGVRGMCPEEKEVQTETQCRGTKSINLCSGAQEKEYINTFSVFI